MWPTMSSLNLVSGLPDSPWITAVNDKPYSTVNREERHYCALLANAPARRRDHPGSEPDELRGDDSAVDT